MVDSSLRWLAALPVYNEAPHVNGVLDEVRRYCREILVVDDGSTDQTASLLAERTDVRLLRHSTNRGYGAALRSAFRYAREHAFDVVVTIDCDGQHEPQRIPRFVAACRSADVVSGSRYLTRYPNDVEPPAQRRRINRQLTAELNRRLGLKLTDAFCGFKAYRVEALERLELNEDGYAMPLEFWVQAAVHRLRIIELPVPLIYLEEARSFGGALDDSHTRLVYYRDVLERSIAAVGMPAAGNVDSLCGEGTG